MGTWRGPITFNGFLTDGTPLATPRRPRKLIFLGDSITASSGSIGTAPCVEQLNSTNGVVGYAARLARGFGANVTVIAYSGKGLYDNCCDPADPAQWSERMPGYWLQAYGGNQYAPPAWDPAADFAGYAPGEVAMVVNLGTK